MKKLLTAPQLAEALQVSLETVRVWAREGRIPCVRPTPQTLRFDEDEVMAALRGRKEDGE